MIQAERLCKSFGKVQAVRELSFEIAPGEIVGFLGPNGAGKSTTMRMLTGGLAPDSGRVRIEGRDVFEEPIATRAALGYLPENNPTLLDMRVGGYLDYRGQLRGMSKQGRLQDASRVAQACDLADVFERRIGHLSKGYRQRVGLAAAMLGQPPALILDEPTSGLDPRQIHTTRELIRSLRDKHTIILSSHYLAEIEMTCDRALILSKGRLVGEGAPEELRDRFAGDTVVGAEIGGASAPEIEGALSALGKAQYIGETTGGCHQFEVMASGAQGDPGEAVYQCVSDRGWRLRELGRRELSLEEVFLHLTSDQGGEGS